ncbi:hypothetical protein PR048_025022 [Dryococelus australis]|uniref:Uncharacterized protein n=1 Tax=Dryococelus australis TaxID=614101 RepID=A0ABQ9GQ68_9NEOP|nr:hypothetical protein PR048_025022 [Dryococelus australis]
MRIHKLRAKTFYSILKDEPAGVIHFSLDCQKDLASPKVPDQEWLSLMKRGKWFGDCTPELLPRGVVLNSAKVIDIKILLASLWQEMG